MSKKSSQKSFISKLQSRAESKAKQACKLDQSEGNEEESDGDELGPSLPPNLVTSSQPRQSANDKVAENEEDEDGCYAGANIVGPTLPAAFYTAKDGAAGSKSAPAVSGGVANDSDDDDSSFIGPALPSSSVEREEDNYLQRLAQFETEKMLANAQPKREEWMTVLPDSMKKAFGLSAKTSFNQSSSSSQTAAERAQAKNLWTAEPTKSGGKSAGAGSASDAEHLSQIAAAERDQLEQQKADALNVDRRESLMELHQKKRRRLDGDGENTEDASTQRRPFNRDTDMQMKGFQQLSGEQAKQRLGNLGSRFAASSSRKFL